AGFHVDVYLGPDGVFEVGSADPKPMISLLLQRKRELSGLSLAQAAERLGASSRNAYARYEQGRAAPSIEKLNELLRAVSPDTDIVINETVLA
ncbi:MAG TPA: XRE family transcriptional regulator, partial [Anaerolineae bacterium]|nr:XRE family transcriptional regulator [Anaerolineae bacterium]